MRGNSVSAALGLAVERDRCGIDGVLVYQRYVTCGAAVDRTGTWIDKCRYALARCRHQGGDGALDVHRDDALRVGLLARRTGGDDGATDHRLDRPDGERAAQVGRRQDGATDQREAPGERGEHAVGTGGERDAVQTDHVAAGGEQLLDDVERDKAGSAGDQDGHVGEDSVRLEIRGCLRDRTCDHCQANVAFIVEESRYAVNYRHAFHAGAFSDCLKHAVLVWLLRSLQRKPAPVFVLDTHAGVGRYDLAEGPAARTGEWRSGIARLLDDPPGALADYVGLVRSLGLYPGSPMIARALLRAEDRLACCELHPEDAAALRRLFARDRQVAVHRRDGWEALGALLPPKERRGLVLIDPPFEDPHEFAKLATGLVAGRHRFSTGIFAAWYPIKHRAPVRKFLGDLRESGIRDIVAVELLIREPIDPGRLNGCGMLVINPPFQFEQNVLPILTALINRFGECEHNDGPAVLRLVDE
jgi:23S rRNA (adenine2030-N6)-methyltransferase